MSTALKSLSLMGERTRCRHQAAVETVFRLGDVSADLGRLRALEALELINCGVRATMYLFGLMPVAARANAALIFRSHTF